MKRKIARRAARANLYDYWDYLSRPGRLIWANFLAGLFRGIGMAVGFSLLGALIVYLLEQAATQSKSAIGDFIAEIVRIVRDRI